MHPSMRTLAVLPWFHVSGTGISYGERRMPAEELILPARSDTPVDPSLRSRTTDHAWRARPVDDRITSHRPTMCEYGLLGMPRAHLRRSALCRNHDRRDVKKMPKCAFFHGYGMTETSGGVAVSAAPSRRTRHQARHCRTPDPDLRVQDRRPENARGPSAEHRWRAVGAWAAEHDRVLESSRRDSEAARRRRMAPNGRRRGRSTTRATSSSGTG